MSLRILLLPCKYDNSARLLPTKRLGIPPGGAYVKS
jgi:hypothetical protein